MEVVVDGIIYRIQAYGGISQIFNEILPRMCQSDENLNISLLMSGQSPQRLPQHPHIHVKHAPYIGRFLEHFSTWPYPIHPLNEFLWRLSIRNTKDKIWHSTYYTLPRIWRGQIVVTVADMIYELFPDLFTTVSDERFRKHKRHCILDANMVICISETTRKDVLQCYGIESTKTCVIPISCGGIFQKLPTDIEDLNIPTPNPFLLYIGNRYHYKNFKRLIQAYSLWKHHIDVNLIVVGTEWSPDELELLINLNIQNQVQLLNKIDDEALCHLYNKAAAFMYPSLYEGFGIPLLEAMACGCPIVASRIPSTTEVAGDYPVYFDPEETDDFILALEKVLLEGRNSNRSRDGFERVNNFSWKKTAEKTLEVYRSLMI